MVTAATGYDSVDISSHRFWEQPPAVRDETFAELRRRPGLTFHPPAETALLPDEDDPGFWALTRHADIQTASREAGVFASGREHGGIMLENIPEELSEAAHSILAMDEPQHLRQRRLIASVFTPRRVATIEEQIRRQARLIVEAVAPLGEADFATDIAARLPMWTISEMIGIEDEARETVSAAANAMVGWNDPEFIGDGDPTTVVFEALMTLHQSAYALIEARRSRPADDLMTALTAAEVEGERLTDEDIAAFFVLLCVAGNDTTRQTASHTALALGRFPEAAGRLRSNFDSAVETATEEFVRWASPVLTFRRTVVEETELAGQRLAPGDKLALFYRSGNFDDAVFAQPSVFDVLRRPNPHLGYGGGGPHFCLGRHLAKTQLSALFREVLFRLDGLEVGEPTYLTGNFINGIKRLPVTFRPAAGH